MSKKSIFIIIMSFAMYLAVLLGIRAYLDNRPLYIFQSREDEQYFRQIIGKPEGKIIEEDLKCYMQNFFAIYNYEHSLRLEENKISLDYHEEVIKQFGDSIKENLEISLFLYHKAGYGKNNLSLKDIDIVLSSMERLPQDDYLDEYASWNWRTGHIWVEYQIAALDYVLQSTDLKNTSFWDLSIDQIDELYDYKEAHPELIKGTKYETFDRWEFSQ